MKNQDQESRNLLTVDLSGYPDLVVIYLGLRVNSVRMLLPALQFGPKLRRALKVNPAGLLRHEFLIFSLFPFHLGIRQYWRDFDSLERWARTGAHAEWWRLAVQKSKGKPSGFGLWHETYCMRGGMEAVYGGVPPPFGFMGFAPIQPVNGNSCSARSRLRMAAEKTVDVPINETEMTGHSASH